MSYKAQQNTDKHLTWLYLQAKDAIGTERVERSTAGSHKNAKYVFEATSALATPFTGPPLNNVGLE